MGGGKMGLKKTKKTKEEDEDEKEEEKRGYAYLGGLSKG